MTLPKETDGDNDTQSNPADAPRVKLRVRLRQFVSRQPSKRSEHEQFAAVSTEGVGAR